MLALDALTFELSHSLILVLHVGRIVLEGFGRRVGDDVAGWDHNTAVLTFVVTRGLGDLKVGLVFEGSADDGFVTGGRDEVFAVVVLVLFFLLKLLDPDAAFGVDVGVADGGEAEHGEVRGGCFAGFGGFNFNIGGGGDGFAHFIALG